MKRRIKPANSGKEIREMVTFATLNVIMAPPLYQAGYPGLPQPFDLSDAGTAEKAPAALEAVPSDTAASLNEELQTVKADMRNLLNSTERKTDGSS